jgi:hypothetical protein
MPVVEVEEPICGAGSPYNGKLNLRIAAIFIILVRGAASSRSPQFAE